MNVKIEATKPESILFTLSITMTLKEWKELRSQLKKESPSDELFDYISDATEMAEKVFWPPSPHDLKS